MAYDNQPTPTPTEDIYAHNNPYGFKLNINHPRINDLYKRYKKYKGIVGRPPRDDERREFESMVLDSKDTMQSSD